MTNGNRVPDSQGQLQCGEQRTDSNCSRAAAAAATLELLRQARAPKTVHDQKQQEGAGRRRSNNKNVKAAAGEGQSREEKGIEEFGLHAHTHAQVRSTERSSTSSWISNSAAKGPPSLYRPSHPINFSAPGVSVIR